jgi:hypothetical protein
MTCDMISVFQKHNNYKPFFKFFISIAHVNTQVDKKLKRGIDDDDLKESNIGARH